MEVAGLCFEKPELPISPLDGGKNAFGQYLDPQMSRLVYKVHKIPQTMQDFIFDFGSLDQPTELLYIQSMVKFHLSTISNDANELSMIAILTSRSQVILFGSYIEA
jgi:hypothetical protein